MRLNLGARGKEAAGSEGLEFRAEGLGKVPRTAGRETRETNNIGQTHDVDGAVLTNMFVMAVTVTVVAVVVVLGLVLVLGVAVEQKCRSPLVASRTSHKHLMLLSVAGACLSLVFLTGFPTEALGSYGSQ